MSEALLYHAIAALVLSIVVHELAHWAVLTIYRGGNIQIVFGVHKGRAYLRTGTPKDYGALSDRQKYWVFTSGVILGGTYAIQYAIGMGTPFYYGFAVLALYLWGCRHDVRVLRHIHEQHHKNGEVVADERHK